MTERNKQADGELKCESELLVYSMLTAILIIIALCVYFAF